MKILTAIRVLFIITMFSYVACNNSGKKTGSDKVKPEYLGEYKGMLPCADCPGIKTKLELKNDSVFILEMEYMERDAKFEEEGIYEVHGDIVTCFGRDEDMYLKIGKNTLTMLDAQKKEVTGSMAPMFVLKKDID